jgi:CRISPR/Cas system CMR-associated protein Cmr5 small subunit
MIVFRCDRIGTDIERRLKENLEATFQDKKHIYLVASRWDEYKRNINIQENAEAVKDHLKSRLMAKYKKVFVTIGDIGFLSAKMVKITTTSKLTWEAAKPWAQKCISTTLTNLKDLESDYEEMTLCTLKRRVAVGLHNSGIDELVNYINGDMVNEIKYKAISYLCTAFITHLLQFENKDEKERQNDMRSIFKVNEELKKIFHKRDKITELLQVSRDFVHASTSDIFLKGESFRNIHNYLENKFDEIKQEARNISYTDTTNIARSSMDDIIFYVEDSYKITDFIRNEISKAVYECITNEVDEISGKLNEVLSDAGSGLLGSDLYMHANTCIDVLDIDDFSYTGDISFHTSSVRIEGSNAIGGFKSNERISDHLISISQASYMEEVYRIAREVLGTYKSRINLHIDNAIKWYLESIDEGGTKISKI